MGLASVLLAGLRPPAPAGPPQLDELERTLEAIVLRAREDWGAAFDLPAEAFVRHLAERMPPDGPTGAALERLRTSDLFLACGCCAGDPRAIQACDAHCRPALATVLARLRVPPHEAEELVQELRARLFVARPDRPPLIAQYSGRGRLAEWVRVACLRAVLKQRARREREVPIEDQILTAIPAREADPELQVLKETYRQEFRDAFREALGSLSQRERALLRLHFFREMNVDRLGAVFGVHRSTAARWLAGARQSLLERTRAALSHRLGLDEEEWNSVMRLIESRLDVSFRALVGPRRPRAT